MDSRGILELEKNNDLVQIALKRLNGGRISPEEGLYLLNHASLGFLGYVANQITRQSHQGRVYFNRNFHVEPTNLCVYTCSFCSYSRLLKQRDEGWALSIEQIMDIIKSYDAQPVTEVHITGGVIPKQNFEFYQDLFKRIKLHRPTLHIKALTPVELYYIFKKSNLEIKEGLTLLAEAGLDSMPGGGAELFDETLREEIAGGKCSSQFWLDTHKTWHKMGKFSNATMLYGHKESYLQRIDHLQRLRLLQDETQGFQAFIPLKFRNKDNAMAEIPEVSLIEDLKNYAFSRIYLDNIPHIKAYWAMIGRKTAQLSLQFGANDLDGTIDDTTKIYSMAGAEEQHPKLSTQELVDLIRAVGRTPVERDTLYGIIKTYESV